MLLHCFWHRFRAQRDQDHGIHFFLGTSKKSCAVEAKKN